MRKLNKNLVAFCGGMGAGKDTYGEIYKRIIEKENSIEHYSFATPLKSELDILIDYVKKGKTTKEVQANPLFETIELSQLEFIYYLINKELNVSPDFNSRNRSKNIRQMLQFWGTEVRRNSDSNYWTNKAKEFLLDKFNKNIFIYITDARFENEFNLIKELNGTLIKLDASQNERIKRIENRDGLTPSEESLNHPSETQSLIYNNYDVIIKTEEINETNIEKEIRKLL